jgi:hypothetical protein
VVFKPWRPHELRDLLAKLVGERSKPKHELSGQRAWLLLWSTCAAARGSKSPGTAIPTPDPLAAGAMGLHLVTRHPSLTSARGTADAKRPWAVLGHQGNLRDHPAMPAPESTVRRKQSA